MLKPKLDPIQKAILVALNEHKQYSVIGLELNLPTSVIEYKVKALFCILGFKDITKQLALRIKTGENTN